MEMFWGRNRMRTPSRPVKFATFVELVGCLLWLMPAGAFTATMSSAHAAIVKGCDLQALRRYPMTDALKLRALPLNWPIVTFPAPGEKPSYNLGGSPDPEEELKWKEALARGLGTFTPEERPMLMLANIDAWTDAKDGLHRFFILEQGIYLDEVLATLDGEGLDQYAALFREGRALFGRDYGTVQQRFDRWSDGHGNILDPVLDARLRNLSARYRALPRLLNVAAARIAASPALTAIYEPLRARATDDQKLSYLELGLLPCLSDSRSPDVELADLAALPPAYGRILVVYLFEAEMLNGSVEQFFFNSTGDLAPEVVAALNEIGLEKHARAVQRGIDLFPKPYPRANGQRRAFMLRQGHGFKQTMEELTGIVDDGAIDPALTRFARQSGILPQ